MKILNRHFNHTSESEEINFLKFCDLFEDICPKLKQDELLMFFRSMDSDGNNYISRGHLKKVLNKLSKSSKSYSSNASQSMIQIEKK